MCICCNTLLTWLTLVYPIPRVLNCQDMNRETCPHYIQELPCSTQIFSITMEVDEEFRGRFIASEEETGNTFDHTRCTLAIPFEVLDHRAIMIKLIDLTQHLLCLSTEIWFLLRTPTSLCLRSRLLDLYILYINHPFIDVKLFHIALIPY